MIISHEDKYSHDELSQLIAEAIYHTRNLYHGKVEGWDLYKAIDYLCEDKGFSQVELESTVKINERIKCSNDTGYCPLQSEEGIYEYIK